MVQRLTCGCKALDCWAILASSAMPIAILTAPAAAQTAEGPDAFLNQQRRIQDEIDRQMKLAPSINERYTLDYGGWYSFYLFLYDDGVNSSRTYRRNDLRAWGRLTLDQGAHEFFARARLSYIDFNTGDSYDGNDNDWEGPNLERGYYRFDLKRAMSAYAGKYIDYNIQVEVGRDLVVFGEGLALSTPLDHVQVIAQKGPLQVTGLIGKTVGSITDFDQSRPIERQRRAMFGVETRLIGIDNHEPFAYVFWQDDHNHEVEPHPLQGFDYESVYVGLGSTGTLAPNLRYATEWVFESGSSYSQRRFLKQNDITAWSTNTELEYLFPGPKDKRASLQYLFASGDPDRRFSPTDTIGGNDGDYDDNSFIGFGWVDTGLSFAPRPVNLHLWRVGGSFFPFEGHERFDKLELGLDAYLFWKNRRSGGVSDYTAGRESGYLGWEMDVYANWQITSDLAWTTRLGTFFPGRAFDDQTTRTFFLVGVTWSF
jgi:hypothetical protein